MVIAQTSRLGPRFFIPKAILDRFEFTAPPSWDYHPIPQQTDEESSPLAVEDCPICLSAIQLTPETKEEKEDGSFSDKVRWSIMTMPCGHVCHTECLEGWMRVKSVCPFCRHPLPAV